MKRRLAQDKVRSRSSKKRTRLRGRGGISVWATSKTPSTISRQRWMVRPTWIWRTVTRSKCSSTEASTLVLKKEGTGLSQLIQIKSPTCGLRGQKCRDQPWTGDKSPHNCRWRRMTQWTSIIGNNFGAKLTWMEMGISHSPRSTKASETLLSPMHFLTLNRPLWGLSSTLRTTPHRSTKTNTVMTTSKSASLECF